MSDLSFGSFPDLLDSNTTSGELGNFEQSTTTEQNKCAVCRNRTIIRDFNSKVLCFVF